MPDTLMPMDIDQSKHRPETCTCYNYNKKGHLSQHCPKLQKQQNRSAESTEVKLKGLVTEAEVAVLDAQEVAKKAEEPKECF